MKLVIEIPDHIYQTLIETGKYGYYRFDARRAIKKGKSLPRGCGRLGDLSALVEKLNEAQIEGTDTYKGLGVAKQIVIDAPTIIEADNAESEDKE